MTQDTRSYDSQEPPTENARCLLLTKNGHRYVFCYRRGQERDLYFTLIDCARDPRTALSWSEVFLAMRHVAPFAASLRPKP
ncbi:MAG: hypothetical protein KAX80_02485 [Planctomycetes bacterium]|nr:hypothetical protein [Planctomycetota bacterium]